MIHSFDRLTNRRFTHSHVPMSMPILVRSFTGQWSPTVRRFLNSSQQCSSARIDSDESALRCPHSPTVDFDEQTTDIKMAITESRLTTQARTSRRQHVSSPLLLSDALWWSLSDLRCFSPLLTVTPRLLYPVPNLEVSQAKEVVGSLLRHSSSLEHFPESFRKFSHALSKSHGHTTCFPFRPLDGA